MKNGKSDFWAPGSVCAAVGMLVFVAVFAWELRSFASALARWAQRDLDARAELAATNLREKLETQDFRSIRAFGDACAAEGVHLQITTGGGKIFDSSPVTQDAQATVAAVRACGEYEIRLTLPEARVFAPLKRAAIGFALAGLVGAAGMLFVFLGAYRQRLRVRELMRLDRFRTSFIADLSHEIKTPLAGIVGAVDLLREAGDSLSAAERREMLALAKKESLRLDRLARDVVELARLDDAAAIGRQTRAGGKWERTDIGALATATCERFAAGARGSGRTVTCTAAAGCAATCDAAAVERALANLVRNALVHTASPTVEVSVRKDRGMVNVAVTDRGQGVPEEHRAHIFDRFYRVDDARTAETGGSGLGLAIVRSVAREHGGEAFCEPVTPHGTRFSFELPIG